jgi:hypothetical protein
MPISIFSATATPSQLPNGTTIIVINFDGQASTDGTNILVNFTISPFPELSFNGNRTVNAPYVLNTSQQSFSRTVTVNNLTSSSASDWKNGLIALNAIEHTTNDHSGTYAAIIYQ